MQTITLESARAQLGIYMDQVAREQQGVVITRDAAPPVVLLSLREYESWRETMHLMRGKNGPRLLKAVDDINAFLNRERRKKSQPDTND